MDRDFELIYRDNVILVLKFLLKIGCKYEIAEDIVQDTFVKAISHIDTFKEESSLSTWLCQIARNTYYSYLKKNMNNRFENIDQIIDQPLLVEDTSERVKDILDVLKYIEEPYQSVFAYRILLNLDYAQIAKKYSKSDSWARVTFYRAKIKIQDIYFNKIYNQ